jgi:retron-type reverse transcriptase
MEARRGFISKPGSSEQRPLSIPSARDRVVQAAAKIVLELVCTFRAVNLFERVA